MRKRATLTFIRQVRCFLVCLGCALTIPSIPSPAASPQRIQANTNLSPAGVLANGVLTLDLEIREGEWFPEDDHGPSLKVFALAEPGKPAEIPGPLIRVPENTTVHARIHNLVAMPVVLHGMHSRPGKSDDVLQIPPGEVRDVTFQAGIRGAYYYWATAGGDTLNGRPYKEDGQLVGAFIVDPAGAILPDRIFVISVWRDRLLPQQSFDVPVINGKAWPYTERLEYTAGADVRWRWLNVSAQVHPMHMHGSYFRVDTVGDGETETVFSPARRKLVSTELMPIGGTMTTYWHPTEPGRWLFHCHILTHISPDTMMFRHANPQPASASHDHPGHDMTGLVMGITVLPPPGDRSHPEPPKPRRHLELIIDNQQGGSSRSGYTLTERGHASGAVHAPGPALVLTRGEPVAIRVINRLSEPTSIHWHGIELQSYYDGVPGWTGFGDQVTPMIQPGKSFDVFFNPPRAGTFIYHTHMNDLSQLASGLYGPIIVLPPGETFQPDTDKIFIMSRDGMREDGEFLLNGATTPPPQQWHPGLQYRLRFININANNTVRIDLKQNGNLLTWTSLAKDGADLPPEQSLSGPASLLIAPGETYDFQFRPEHEGDMQLTLDLALLKEKVTQVVHLEPSAAR